MNPGEFRRSQNWVGGTRPGNALYVPPPINELNGVLDAFEHFMHEEVSGLPPLIKAGLLHVQFETIHPFLGGNGRVGRLLITLYLCVRGVLHKPLLYLSLYLKTHRAEYYRLLQEVRERGEWEIWLAFFLEGVAETANQAFDAATRIVDLFRRDRDRIAEQGERVGSALRVHDFLQQNPLVTGNRLVQQTGLSAPTVNLALADLEALGIFESTKALPLTRDQLGLLIEAADSRWRDVEPAIFGTLLERALDPNERHALGAHYTPRAYVERLVIPTLVEPIRDNWRNAQAVITQQVNAGNQAAAIETAQAFHRQLCSTRVLDPACGSGNFLYVALEHMKRLEGEVLETLQALGETQQALEHTGFTVDPHQFLGMELNPHAAVIADLVLWIGYLQWHFRTRGDAQPPIPVIRNFHNIVEADALLKYDEIIPALNDSDGSPITEWDRVTFTISKITGRKIPDLTVRKTVLAYTEPERREWPACDFIVGNPPFIGKGEKLLKDLGDGYVKTLRRAYKGLVPDGSDFVMYWWKKAAALVVSGSVRQAGLISTNSISQKFNSRVVAEALSGDSPGHLAFAIPDHPWIDSKDGAAVRIAMTVVAPGVGEGIFG